LIPPPATAQSGQPVSRQRAAKKSGARVVWGFMLANFPWVLMIGARLHSLVSQKIVTRASLKIVMRVSQKLVMRRVSFRRIFVENLM